MGKSSPPPAPDYAGAAREQGAANLEAARASSQLNNPNVVSPYGTQTVSYGTGFDQAGYDRAMSAYEEGLRNNTGKFKPAGGGQAPDRNAFTLNKDVPTFTQKFSPEQQRLYDLEVGNKEKLGGLASQGADALSGVVGKPVDFSGMPAMPGSADATRDKVVGAMMGRVNEDYGRSTDQANSDMVAAGIRPGSKAYDDKMHLLDRGLNDARQQAMIAGGAEAQRDFGMDTTRRKDAIAEYLSQRQIPLNEITALMSGGQVQNPFAMPGYSQNSQVAPAPMYQAASDAGQYGTDVFNMQQAQQGQMMSGLFGLGSAAMMSGAGAPIGIPGVGRK